MGWEIRNPSSIDLYRERTAASVPVTLRRKRCTCGKVATAKQLKQYGTCATCVRADTSTLKEAA